MTAWVVIPVSELKGIFDGKIESWKALGWEDKRIMLMTREGQDKYSGVEYMLRVLVFNEGDLSGMILASNRVSPPGLQIIIGIEKTKAYAVLDYMLMVNLGILCFAGILAIVFLGVIARNISTPIIKLKEWAVRLSRGHLAAEPFTPSSDEIGELNVSCARVVSSFQDIASVCESISEGDFSRTLERRTSGAAPTPTLLADTAFFSILYNSISSLSAGRTLR